MKRTILATILVAACLGAVEVTVLGGGNYQRWKRMWAYLHVDGNEPEDPKEYGFGLHGGILLGLGVLPGLSMEAGCLYQKDNVTTYYPSGGKESWSYNNLVFPMLFKGDFKITPKFRIGLGIGLSLTHNLSGKISTDTGTRALREDELGTYWGWQMKGDVGIKLLPALWLKPGVSAQFKLPAEAAHKKQAVFLSLGLALKL